MSTAVATQPQTPIEKEGTLKLMGILKKYQRTFEGVLPKHLTPDRWAWLCVSSIRMTPALVGCTPASFINSVLLASNLGIEIRSRSAYLIPYGSECTLVVDYRSKIDLGRRSGKLGEIGVELIREADDFEYYRTDKGPHFLHRPVLSRMVDGHRVSVDDSERGEIIGGYVQAQIIGADRQLEVMTLNDIEGIRKRSKAGRRDLTLAEIRALDIEKLPYNKRVPWLVAYNQMARKTVIHRAANYWPQSPELVLSQEVDDALIEGGKAPIAPELGEFMMELDPADNQPMIEIPETREEQIAEQQAIAEAKILAADKPRQEALGISDADVQFPGDPEPPLAEDGPSRVTVASFSTEMYQSVIVPYLAYRGATTDAERSRFLAEWQEGRGELLTAAMGYVKGAAKRK